MIEVEVSAVVNPTEEIEKVAIAIVNIFPKFELDLDESTPKPRLAGSGEISSLEVMHELFRKEQVLDTALKQLEKGRSVDRMFTHFTINKQVAFVNHLNFPAEEEPLGSIHVIIKAGSEDELDRLVDWLAPPTEEGKPLFEIDITEV
jgi:predicted RNA binding protein with dsRBD fold (UPF0201 family)